MALFAQKALQFVRAPDENVFIARESPRILFLFLGIFICNERFLFSKCISMLALGKEGKGTVEKVREKCMERRRNV